MPDSIDLECRQAGLAMTLRARRLSLVCLVTALGLFAVPSFAAAAGDLTPDPTQLELGTQDIHKGSTPTQTVKLENLTGEGLNVDSIEVTGPDAANFSFDSNCSFVNVGEACAVNVSFNPSTPGAKVAEVEVVDDNGTVIVPLTGTGATGTLSGSSPTFNQQPYYFGGQQQNANISNNSSFSVAGTNATISGPDAAFFYIAFNGCQFTINPGENCSIGVGFNPSAAGTKTAQLELMNDGTVAPVIVPLSATALAGPDAVISPSGTDFGEVAVGSVSAPEKLSIANAGDYPLQVQQLLVISGSPQLFPLTDDSCSQQVIAPGSSCQFTERFQPSAAGTRDATIFVITNQNGPVTTANLSGTGVLRPGGSASIDGTAAAGSPLSCVPNGYSDGTRFAYQWLRDGQAVAAATAEQFTPGNADVGSRLACRLQATNSVGAETVTSPPSAPVAARDLSALQGSIVGTSVCRAVQAPARLSLGGKTVKLSYGKPTTPGATLRLEAPGLRMQALLDDQAIAGGKGRVVITPRALVGFADGSHTLQVSSNSSDGSVQIALAPCGLAVNLDGGPRRTTTVTVSAAAGMSEPLIQLPKALHIDVSKTTLGSVSVQLAGQPAQVFSLDGARTSFNGITAVLKAHSIRIKRLPAEAGVVTVELNGGVIGGHGGAVKATATLRGTAGPSRAVARTIWRP
jgi:hypothetical protein